MEVENINLISDKVLRPALNSGGGRALSCTVHLHPTFKPPQQNLLLSRSSLVLSTTPRFVCARASYLPASSAH